MSLPLRWPGREITTEERDKAEAVLAGEFRPAPASIVVSQDAGRPAGGGSIGVAGRVALQLPSVSFESATLGLGVGVGYAAPVAAPAAVAPPYPSLAGDLLGIGGQFMAPSGTLRDLGCVGEGTGCVWVVWEGGGEGLRYHAFWVPLHLCVSPSAPAPSQSSKPMGCSIFRAPPRSELYPVCPLACRSSQAPRLFLSPFHPLAGPGTLRVLTLREGAAGLVACPCRPLPPIAASWCQPRWCQPQICPYVAVETSGRCAPCLKPGLRRDWVADRTCRRREPDHCSRFP
jgi:hypothetical protein